MSTPDDVLRQIRVILRDLISCSLAIDQNFPSSRRESDGVEYIDFGKRDISIVMDENKSYHEIYDVLNKNKIFTCKLVDGAIVQLMYMFKNNKIYKHRLAFFPSPYLEKFQNEPDYYEDDALFSDVLHKNIVAFPIRFDFDAVNQLSEDDHHPASHLTLGQYKNCRIPVSSPLTPSQFFDFILRNFYNTAFNTYCDKIHFVRSVFDDTITDDEKKISYITISSMA